MALGNWFRTRRTIQKGIDMSIGAFSISLAVKDIKASKTFYEKLGFVADGWAMLRNTAS